MKKTLFIVLLICMSIQAYAGKGKVFFDAKNNIVSITGDASIFTSSSFGSKFFLNDVDLDVNDGRYLDKKGYDKEGLLQELQSSGAALKIMRYLYVGKDGKLTQDLLRQRALKNTSDFDEEVAEAEQISEGETGINAALMSPEKMQEIVNNNYIFFRNDRGNKIYWIAFRLVGNDDDILKIRNEIFDGEKDPAVLDSLNVTIEYVADGKRRKGSSFWDDLLSDIGVDVDRATDNSALLMRNIGKKVPAFVIKGQTMRHEDSNGLYVNIGTNSGLREMDQMVVYRSVWSKKLEKNISKKVCTTRIISAEQEQARLYTIAGGWANTKRGDMAILKPDAHMASLITVGYQNKAVDVNYNHDFLLGMNSSGISYYALARAGVAWYLPSESSLKEKDQLVMFDTEEFPPNLKPVGYLDTSGNAYMFYLDNFSKPVVFNLGVGPAASWHFAHKIEIMPYVMAEAQLLYAPKIVEKEKTGSSTGKGEESNLDISGYMTGSIRFPVGCRVNINLAYPFQLTLGAEWNVYEAKYNYLEKTDKEKEQSTTEKEKGSYIHPYYWWNNSVAKPNGMTRTGLRIYAGLRWCF